MNAAERLVTLNYYPGRAPHRRLFALWYFTTLLILWNILGHTILGFEQSWAQPVAGVMAAIAMQILLEWLDTWSNKRALRFTGIKDFFVSFLPPAIIPGLACAMLIYPNERLSPVIFAAGLSIASKAVLRAPVGNGRTQHVFNPSNFGITATLLLFSWVGLAPAYHFTENVTGIWNWIVPGIILISGIIIHSLFTGRLPLCSAWLAGFVMQALLRRWLLGTSLFAALAPTTSAAFILFTLYMIPDPATTPIKRYRQVAFGLAIAATYGLLQILHVVYGLFIALAAISAIRGICLHLYAAVTQQRAVTQPSVTESEYVESKAMAADSHG